MSFKYLWPRKKLLRVYAPYFIFSWGIYYDKINAMDMIAKG